MRKVDAGDAFWEFVRDRQVWDERLRVGFVRLLNEESFVTDSRYARKLLIDLFTLWGFCRDCLPVEFIAPDGNPATL